MSAMGQSGHKTLFDHLVGAAEQAQRERNTQRLRSLEIDDQLDFCDLLHRQVGRPFALENPAGIDTGLPPSIKIVRSVAHNRQPRRIRALNRSRGTAWRSTSATISSRWV